MENLLKTLEPVATSIYWKIGILVFLAVAIFSFLFYFRKNAIIENLVKKNVDRTILRQKELKKNLKKKEESDFYRKVRENLAYSGLSGKFKFLTPENWIGILSLLGLIGFLVALFTTKRILTGLVLGALLIIVALFIESILKFDNYRKVDKCMIEFLNLLGNYSSQNTEITDVFEKIYHRVEEPLQSALKECIYESESLGTDKALLNLASKIEHPKFKEIIQNIRISIKHSDTFKEVVENNNQNLSDYIKLKKEAEQLAIGNFVQLSICAVLGAIIVFICGRTLNINIIQFVRETPFAQLMCLVAVLSMGYAAWQVYEVSK